MRIAQVAPLALPVPPRRYGGTERVVHDLTEALIERGHEVTLFASGDSRTRARLVAVVPTALWKDAATDPMAADFLLHMTVFERAAEFDLIHCHTSYRAFPYIAASPAAVLTTLHGRLDISPMGEILRRWREARLVAISDAQQAQVPGANWAGTVHHGLPLQDYAFEPRPGERLVYLGRFSADKAPHAAIDIAREAGLPIALAGRVDPLDRAYFEHEIQPRLAQPGVEFVGELDDDAKRALLRSARALLFPIDWPEPFGLVMIEAMACGTPVVVRPKGAAPEVVVDGETGFLADDRAALVAAVRDVHRIDRAACRRRVEERFSVAAMADRYEALYREELARPPRGTHASSHGRAPVRSPAARETTAAARARRAR